MKKLWTVIAVILFSTSLFAQKINVQINGIENNRGVIQIGLYNDEASFPSYEGRIKGVALKANDEGVNYTFIDIPEGTYAIAAWHDKDDDKTMNKNLFGSPREKYGFSKNLYGTFGPPKFDVVSFKVTKSDSISIKINLE